MRTRFPIFIVSKGRWKRPYTARYLMRMGVQFRMIVEEQEADDYATVVGHERLLILDPEYKRVYDPCDDLGDTRTKGSGPARNFAWDTAEGEGAPWHWTVDDNIAGFYRYHRNTLIQFADGTPFRVMEDFVDRYENIAMAGPNYYMFIESRTKYPPFYRNTRIYSCNLIRTDTPYRWRARYNEDTDLSIRMLKDGWCTVLFNAFLQNKLTTQTVPGGNQELYSIGTLPKSEMIEHLHPDVARVTWRYGRWHHVVDYNAFNKNTLRVKPGIVIPEGSNEYGLILEHRLGDAWMPESAAPAPDEWNDLIA